jgi:opacity protein-like surface antigen
MRRFLLAAMLLGVASSAGAADMPDIPILRGSFTDGLTSSRANWQGYYVGGQAEYGSAISKVPGDANADLQRTFVRPPTADYNWQPLGMAHSFNNGFGAFAGYNAQFDDVVVGVEANYTHAGIRSITDSVGYRYLASNPFAFESLTHSTAIVKQSDFGSARLRGGYVVGCFLPYAFVGAGFGSQTIDRSVSAFPDPIAIATTSASKSKMVYGYTAGAGVDMMLIGGLFARAEYEYRRVTTDVETNVNTVRLGLGYKF